jgi:hypothetical protein
MWWLIFRLVFGSGAVKLASGDPRLKWAGAIAVVTLLGYATMQMAGVASTEDDIGVVDFSDLSSSA